MAISLIDATDEMLAIVRAAWDANAAAIVGGTTALLYEIEKRNQEPNPVPKAWARVTVRHGEAEGFAFQKHYTNTGTLYVNIFVRESDGAGSIGQRLAIVITDALRAHVLGQVEFSRVRPQEAGLDGKWVQTNVLAAFAYSQGNY